MQTKALVKFAEDELDVHVGSWREFAACNGADPDLFFPNRGGSGRLAKMICMKCPVRELCLEDALARQEKYGIWGGMTHRERKKWKV